MLWLLFILAIYAPYLFWADRTHKSFRKKMEGSIKAEGEIHQPLSIIIPFRNENGTVQKLVNQLLIQISGFENCEVILVNDHSTDGGEEAIGNLLPYKNVNFQLINAQKEGKKNALTEGIQLAKNDWIVTLDADISIPALWMDFVAKTCANAPTDMVILPVDIFPYPKFYQKIEALEFTVLQGITFGYAQQQKPILANGAHLAFKKKAFFDFSGYSSHEHMASGDDVFFMEQLQLSESHSVGYSYYHDMSVSTEPSSSFMQLLNQKIRWGSKTFKFKSNDVKRIGVLILTANLALFPLFYFGNWRIFALGFFIKSACDLYLVLFPLTARSRKTLLKYIPLFMVVYPFYITFVSVATLFLKPKWKGRKI